VEPRQPRWHLGQQRPLAAIDDHGILVQRSMAAKSETLSPFVIMTSVLSGQQQSHDHEAGWRGDGRDHGSSAGGGWQDKSPDAGSARLVIKWTAALGGPGCDEGTMCTLPKR
jgi:hypothetical protein